jgi:hypothetical protein
MAVLGGVQAVAGFVQQSQAASAQNKAQRAAFERNRQIALESFANKSGQIYQRFLQQSEAFSQKMNQLHRDADENVAANAVLRGDTTMGRSVRQTQQASHQAEGRAMAAIHRQEAMEIASGMNTLSMDSAGTAHNILSAWKPDVPQPSIGMLLINVATSAMNAYVGAKAAGLGETLGNVSAVSPETALFNATSRGNGNILLGSTGVNLGIHT